MVNEELVSLIQTTANNIITNYTETINNVSVKPFKDYTCIIHGEIDYRFQEATPLLIEANILFGAGTKQNDIEDKYNQSFVINIQSEINGYEKAQKLFVLVFETLSRTYQTLGDYKSKIFLTSPVIINPFNAIESDFRVLLSMNGSMELSKKVVLGSTYKLSCDNGTNYITVKSRQPYCMKECIGANDQTSNSPTIEVFTKEGNTLTINLVLILELDGGDTETAHDTLFKKLFNECYENSNDKYTFQNITGSITKTISNLICVRGQHLYDETTGENVLSLQFKVGA